MSRKQYVFLTIHISFTALLGALQFVDKDRVEKSSGFWAMLYATIYGWRLSIALFLGIGIALIAALPSIYMPRIISHRMRKTIMETILAELFDDDKNNVRVTIFRDAGWLHILIIYLYRSILQQGPKFWRWSGRPKWGKYVLAKERVGSENPNSRTYFYYSTSTSKNCLGIAGKVRHDGTDIVVNDLPDISQVNLATVDLSRKTTIAKKVNLHLEKGYIDLANLEKLHTRARHFYGNILYNYNSQPIGVLVIDSIKDKSPFDEATITKLGHYTKLFSATFH